MQPKDIENKERWAVFSPSGEIDMRSIDYTAEAAISSFKFYRRIKSWDDMEELGYTCHKILLTVKVKEW